MGEKKVDHKIIEHNEKRKIYLKCAEEEERLKEKGLSEKEIQLVVEKYRLKLEKEYNRLRPKQIKETAANDNSDETDAEKAERVKAQLKESLNNIKTIVNPNEGKIKSFEEGSIVKQSMKNAELVRKAKYQ